VSKAKVRGRSERSRRWFALVALASALIAAIVLIFAGGRPRRASAGPAAGTAQPAVAGSAGAKSQPFATAPSTTGKPVTSGPTGKNKAPKGDAGADAGGDAGTPTNEKGTDKGTEKASDDNDRANGLPAALQPKEDDKPKAPIVGGVALPVHLGVAFLEVQSFDDTKGVLEATVDVRMKWHDGSLHYDPAIAYKGYKEFRGKDAESVLEKIWHPKVEVTNRSEVVAHLGYRVRVFPNGNVEYIERTHGKHQIKVDPSRFPFDRQELQIDFVIQEDTKDEVFFHVDSTDVAFSAVAKNAELDGWDFGIVQLKQREIRGWNGDSYSSVSAKLMADRVASSGLAPIFIPLMASLLIPLLALWMNRTNEEGYDIEAFELANMGIGGLFSVIALSFAIYSSYGVIAGSDNTVTRLFALNYVTLAVSLGVVVSLFRFNALHRLFGRYVNAEAFHVLTWALPLLTTATSAAFLLAAAA
jgi:uncharacterized Tic20 family protein